MAEFPVMLFRKGGPYIGGYDVAGAKDADELSLMQAAGWHMSKDAALGRADEVLAEVIEAQEAVDAITPATRDELEQKARELGVSFNARTKDEVLAERIASAL